MTYVMLEGSQTAINADHIMMLSVSGRETGRALTITTTLGGTHVIRRYGSFTQAEEALTKLALALAMASASEARLLRISDVLASQAGIET